MKTKISKSQLEVWDWKAEAAKELSGVSPNNVIDFVSKNVSDMKSFILEGKSTKYSGNKNDFSIVAEK